MRIILSLSFLMASLAMQAQSYTITERVCRMWIDNPSRTVEVLLLDRIDWRKVGSNSDEYEFSDGISTVRLRDAYLVNYPTVDSLINQIEAWIDSCAIPPNLWPIQVCDTSNITVNGVVTDAATDASNDGEIAITTYGGQSPYTYAWTGPGGYTSTDEDITGLDNGTYTVTVTDANACTGSQSFEVGIAACDGVTITFTATVTDEVTEGAEDGEIEINTTSGGTGPYTYAWTGPNGYTSSSEDITDLADGDYTVTATDANGCTGDSTFTVGPGFPCSVTNITFTAVVTDESIDQQNDGEIDLTTAGGASPYTWSWRGPRGYTASTEDISNLGDGNYTVTATDANNCQGDTTFTIDPGPTICDTSNILFNAVVVDETIEGLEDGSIDLTTYGGTPPYTWLWRGPTGFRETTEDISNLADGDYTVTVTDNNGCQGDTTYTIDPGFPCDTTNIGFVAVITNASDSAVSDGEIDLTTYGGSKVYTWAWTGPGGYTATTEDITGLAEGEYTVIATDSNNCFSDTTFTVGVDPVETLFANTKSIDLDGSAEYVEVPDDASLSFTNDTVSISAWIWMSDPTGFVIAEKDDEYLFWVNASDKLEARFIDSTDGDFVGRTYNTAITTYRDQWVHVAATMSIGDPDTLDLYLNGLKVDDTNISNGTFGSMQNTDNVVTIGYEATIGPNFATGKIDQFAIWNDTLSLEDIKDLISIRDVTKHPLTDALVLYQEYDAPDSTQTNGIIDLSTAGNDGTMQAGQYADLNVTVPWPYDYQLDTSSAYENLTPMQSSVEADSLFGGFGWELDGVSGNIAVDDDPLLSFGNGTTDVAFSICGWMAPSSTVLMNMIGKQNEYQIGTRAAPSHLLFALYDADASNYIQKTIGAPLARYEDIHMHVCCTYDGSSDTSGMKIYVNGTRLDNAGFVAGTYVAMEDLGNNLTLGAYTTSELDGILGHQIIFDKELSGAEVKQVYNNHAPRDELSYGLADNIVGYWRANQSTNTSYGVIDQGPNGLDGNPSGLADEDFKYMGTVPRYASHANSRNISASYPREIYESDSVGSFAFTGTEYIQLVDERFNLQNGTDDYPFTIAFYMWRNDDNSNQIVYRNGPYPVAGISHQWAQFNHSNPRFAIFDSDVDYIGRMNNLGGVGTYYPNEWVMLWARYDGSETEGGIDIGWNLEYDTDNAANSSGAYGGIQGNDTLWIGGGSGSNKFNGSLSYMYIIRNQDLTNEQIEELYNEGSPIDIRDATFFDADHCSQIVMYPSGIVKEIVSGTTGTLFNLSVSDFYPEIHPTN